MILILPSETVSKIVESLAQAGSREIGGILMGEHIGADTFRVRELTVQRRGGTFAAFVRLVEDFIAPLRTFFHATKHDYARFNYVGEWHSHHSFALIPSRRDNSTMFEIIMDPDFGAHFVVLMLVKLDSTQMLECSVTVYQPNAKPFAGKVLQEKGIVLE